MVRNVENRRDVIRLVKPISVINCQAGPPRHLYCQCRTNTVPSGDVVAAHQTPVMSTSAASTEHLFDFCLWLAG